MLTWCFFVPIRETRNGGNVPSATSQYIKVISRGTDTESIRVWGICTVLCRAQRLFHHEFHHVTALKVSYHWTAIKGRWGQGFKRCTRYLCIYDTLNIRSTIWHFECGDTVETCSTISTRNCRIYQDDLLKFLLGFLSKQRDSLLHVEQWLNVYEPSRSNEPQPHLETPADITASTPLLIHPFLFPFPFPSSTSTHFSSCLAFPHCQYNFCFPDYSISWHHHYVICITCTKVLLCNVRV